jgi:hypothetical protein
MHPTDRPAAAHAVLRMLCRSRGRHHGGKGHVLFSVGVAPGSREHRAMLQRMAAAGIQALDISDVDLAQARAGRGLGVGDMGGEFWGVAGREGVGHSRALLCHGLQGLGCNNLAMGLLGEGAALQQVARGVRYPAMQSRPRATAFACQDGPGRKLCNARVTRMLAAGT